MKRKKRQSKGKTIESKRKGIGGREENKKEEKRKGEKRKEKRRTRKKERRKTGKGKGKICLWWDLNPGRAVVGSGQ